MIFRSPLIGCVLAVGAGHVFAQAAKTQSVEARRVIIDGASRRISDWEPHASMTLESLPPLVGVPPDKFGGRADRQGRKTGFFHTQMSGGRWWIVDPLGNLYLSDGVDSVSPGNSANNKAEFTRKFGNSGAWSDATAALLVRNGNNSLGAWSDDNVLEHAASQELHPLSYSVNLNIMSAYGHEHGGVHMGSGHQTYPQDTIFVFDPQFETFANKFLKSIEGKSNDPNLLGYFSDNEIPLASNNLDGLLSRAKGEPGRVAAEAFLADHHASHPTDELRSQFLEFEAARYFKIVSSAIRAHDPNHMYLGCRFYGRQLRQPEMFRAAGPYADIISVNFYNRWQVEPETTAMWEKESGKPFLISEFYVKADDSSMPNTSGAGWIVHTQKDRGIFYENLVISLLQTKSFVGWHWFRYQDNDPEDKSADPSNIGSNKGIVNTSYDPYTALTMSMQRINTHIYSIADVFHPEPPPPAPTRSQP
jgi:hypothetical protein